MTDLHTAARMARELLSEAINYTSSQAFSPSMTRDIAKGLADLDQALEQPQDEFQHGTCAECGVTSTDNSMHALYCVDCISKMEQPQPEPVARVTGYYAGRCVIEPLNRALVMPDGMALYTHPPHREWQGLSDDEQFKLAKDSMDKSRHWLVAQVEAALKARNA